MRVRYTGKTWIPAGAWAERVGKEGTVREKVEGDEELRFYVQFDGETDLRNTLFANLEPVNKETEEAFVKIMVGVDPKEVLLDES